MKKFILVMMLLLISSQAQALYTADQYIRGRSYFGSGNKLLDPMYLHMVDAANRGSLQTGTGSTFYVDSNVSNEGDGTSWTRAKDTLDEAIDLCVASRGDFILVAQEHAETISGADGWDADIIGITIIHLGNGSLQGIYTFSATDSTVAIGAADVTIVGGQFLAGFSEVVIGISVEAAATHFTLAGASFPEPTTSTFEFNIAIQLTTASDDVTITGCTAYSADDTGADHWLNGGAGVINRLTVTNNLVYGQFAIAPIFSDQVDLECIIANNRVTNLTASEFGIEFSANATGQCSGNTIQTNAIATALDNGVMSEHNNTWVSPTADSAGVTINRPATGTNQLNASTITAINSGLTGVGFRSICEVDAGADTFIAVGLSGFGVDYFNTGWSVTCILNADSPGAAPEGETRDIEAYVTATGVFTVDDDFSAAVTTNDHVYVRRNEDLNFHDGTLTGTSGNIWYCDDGGSAGDGTTWQTAFITLATAEAAMSVGDICYIGANHNENITTGGDTLNVAGTTFIGLGEGDARPLFDFDAAADEITINAAGITLRNLRFRPGATDVVACLVIGSSGDGVTIDSCAFIDGEGADEEFRDCISVDTAAVDFTVKNCTYENSAATASDQDTFLNLDAAAIANASAIANRIFGTFAEAPIWGAAAIPTNLLLKDNIIQNTTSGQLCIEFTGAATGECLNNRLSGDTYGAILDPGSMRCSGNTQTVAINQAAIDVPLRVGETYGISVAKLDGDLDIFDVAGGPILITSFTGLITETVAAGNETTTITFDGVDDFEFSSGVDMLGWVRGSRIVFSITNPAVLTQLPLTTSGSGQTMVPWFCPIGMIEQTDDEDNVQNGGWTWYMTFIPLTEGVTVVAQ